MAVFYVLQTLLNILSSSSVTGGVAGVKKYMSFVIYSPFIDFTSDDCCEGDGGVHFCIKNSNRIRIENFTQHSSYVLEI